MRPVRLLAMLLVTALMCGCVAVPISVSNPIPGLTTVAVAPFLNLSSEAAADGRRFALAYFSELQKNPGFQVIPLGVVEQAIRDNNLLMDSPADAVELARILDADAVVVGAITDYNPYYPPQIGLQVDWYSPQRWTLYPGVAGPAGPLPAAAAPRADQPLVRGQSIDDESDLPAPPVTSLLAQGGPGGSRSGYKAPSPWPTRTRASMAEEAEREQQSRARALPTSASVTRPAVETTTLAPLPIMSYTRFFDGADPQLVAALRDYVTYRGDLRSGGWEGYLQRSEDFIRFTSHLMIVEMLALHGGTPKTEMVCRIWK